MAKKKYYQGGDDRKAESRGMKKAMKSKGDMMPMYSDAMAGMPQEVKMAHYKNEKSYQCPDYPDTYTEKNKQYDAMIDKIVKHKFDGV